MKLAPDVLYLPREDRDLPKFTLFFLEIIYDNCTVWPTANVNNVRGRFIYVNNIENTPVNSRWMFRLGFKCVHLLRIMVIMSHFASHSLEVWTGLYSMGHIEHLKFMFRSFKTFRKRVIGRGNTRPRQSDFINVVCFCRLAYSTHFEGRMVVQSRKFSG